MSKIIFIVFFNFNFLMTVPYIPFVEVILGSFEFIFLNHQFFLSMFLTVFQRFLRMPVNVNQWHMEIGNFSNSISNSLCDYVFYMSKSLMVIAYFLYAVLFRHIVNWALELAIFMYFSGGRLILLIFTQDVFFIGIFYLHSCRTSGIASVYYS